MDHRPRDRDLRLLFQELRAEDRGSAPSFQRLVEGPERGTVEERRAKDRPVLPLRIPARRRWGWGGIVAAAVAAAVATLVLIPERTTPEEEFVMAVRTFTASPAGGRWRSPTDGLLRPPGSEILRTRPNLGGPALPHPPGPRPRPNQS